MFLASLPAVLVMTVIFTVIHALVLRRLDAAYPRAFKLSRGIAAVTLTIVGFFGLGLALPSWREAFLIHEDADSLLRWGVILAYGHLMSDFVWMAYGKVKHGIQPRRDLVFHHGLGALAYGYSLQIEVGYGMVMLSLASEIMPCFTGLEAFGKHRASDATQRLAARARLLVLAFWRIPLWAVALALCVAHLPSPEHAPDLAFVFWFSASCLVLLLGLDLYWVRKSLPAWKGSAKS